MSDELTCNVWRPTRLEGKSLLLLWIRERHVFCLPGRGTLVAGAEDVTPSGFSCSTFIKIQGVCMHKTVRIWLAIVAGLLAAPAWSVVSVPNSYSFEVLYEGGGNASVVPGSVDQRTVTLQPGDSFTWTISALPDWQWTVASGGTVFPLMAFAVQESADRTGDFELQFLNNGAVVRTVQETASVQSLVHMGTNTITLLAGQTFDQLRLQYHLISAFSVEMVEDPDNPGSQLRIVGDTVGSTPTTLLPIFGMVDNTQVANTSTTIYAPVPEPETWALWLAGIAALAARARRLRKPA